MEGMWQRFFPASGALRALLRGGAIGRPLSVDARKTFLADEVGESEAVPSGGHMYHRLLSLWLVPRLHLSAGGYTCDRWLWAILHLLLSDQNCSNWSR